MTTHTCGAIFGPDGRLKCIVLEPDETDAWRQYFRWPAIADSLIARTKEAGHRFSLVTVTEQSASPAPPPPGTRFDEEGVPITETAT
jgi:hypothetical protein